VPARAAITKASRGSLVIVELPPLRFVRLVERVGKLRRWTRTVKSNLGRCEYFGMRTGGTVTNEGTQRYFAEGADARTGPVRAAVCNAKYPRNRSQGVASSR